MARGSPPQRSRQQFWFRTSAGLLLGLLIITAPLYSAGLLRIILVLSYVVLLILVRTGLIGPRR